MKSHIRLLALSGGLLLTLACSTLTTAFPTPASTAGPTLSAQSQQLKVFQAIWQAVNDHYVRADFDGVNWQAVGDTYRTRVVAGLSDDDFAAAMRAMLAELPAGQASFQTRAERLEAETADTTRYEGIGAFISFRTTPTPHVVILEVMDESPAAKAGLQPHDSIYAIDGQPVRTDEADTVADRIRGPADTSVTLTVASPDGQRRDLSVARGAVTISDYLRGGSVTDLFLVYYRLPVITDPQLAANIAEHLLTMAAQFKAKGVILDLRVAHSGGAEWPLPGMLTLFANGELGEMYDRAHSEPLTVEGKDFGGSQTVPLAILIGPDTQGLPEIFAGALRDAGRATLVGLPTPGAIQGYENFPLPDGSRLFLATSSFRTRQGTDFASSGLQPDIAVNSDWDVVTSDADPVLEAAITQLSK